MIIQQFYVTLIKNINPEEYVVKKNELHAILSDSQSRDEDRRLLAEHGLLFQDIEMGSHLVDAHWDTTNEAKPINPHTHSFYELIYCVRGTVSYLLDNRLHLVEPGDIILIPPNSVHAPLFNIKDALPYTRYVIWFSTRFLEELRTDSPELQLGTEPRILKTKNTKWEFVGNLFSRVMEEEKIRSIGWNAMMVGQTCTILVLLSRVYQEQSHVAQKIPDQLENILSYIQMNLKSQITVTETAKAFHISSSKLTHMFQKELGISFYSCVRMRRLSEGKRLISAAEMSMEAIADAVGFSEYSGFYRAFKDEYGISPQQYKKEVLASRSARPAGT